MYRRILTLLIGLFVGLATALVGGTAPAAHAADRDCGDFSTQKAAQIFFLDNGGPHSDPHRLDSEGDGVACESNPCPCYSGKTPPDNGGGNGGGKPKPEPKVLRHTAKVLKVIDGDTIDVKIIKGSKKRIRLIGIDTPEVYGGTDCWGPQASTWLKKRLPRGTRVQLTSDPSQDLEDRYNRLLRYVHKGGTDMNKAQVRAGNAKVYVYDNDPFQRTKAYKSAQSKAKRANAGLWGGC